VPCPIIADSYPSSNPSAQNKASLFIAGYLSGRCSFATGGDDHGSENIFPYSGRRIRACCAGAFMENSAGLGDHGAWDNDPDVGQLGRFGDCRSPCFLRPAVWHTTGINRRIALISQDFALIEG
jgi:hypothetical protein